MNDDKPSIGELAQQTAREAEPAHPQSIVLGKATVARISAMMLQDPNIGTALIAAIEASGANPDDKWTLILRGIALTKTAQ